MCIRDRPFAIRPQRNFFRASHSQHRQHNLDPWSIYIDALEPHYGSRAEAEKVAFGYAAEAVLGNDTKSTPSFETPTELKAANHD